MSSSRHGESYVTDANNRLVSDGVYNYEYDNQGNLIRQTEIATGKIQGLEWDYRNRLVAFVDRDAASNETQRVEFSYDMFGRRLSKTVEGEATYFVYDRDDVILDFVDADGAEGAADPVLDKRYLHGTRVDQVLAQEDSAGDVTWHLSDHLGTIKDLADNSGTLINHFVYDSFGNVVGETNPAVNTRYLYTGREWDEEIGLYHYRARSVKADVGRFVSEDPIGFDSGDTNLYRYVENSPLDTVDPLGLYGRVLNQNRVILYADFGPRIAFNIQDVIDALARNPAVTIIFDNTTADIEYHNTNTGRRIRVDPPNMKLFDQRGHIVGRQLGGSGDINNAFAQNQWINNGIWRGFETRVTNALDRKNQQGCPRVTLSYSVTLTYIPRNPLLPLRPGLVVGIARFSDGDTIPQIAPNP